MATSRDVLRAILLAALVGGSYWLSLGWLSPSGVGAIWLGAGIALAGVMSWGLRHGWSVFAGAVLGAWLMDNLSASSVAAAGGNAAAAVAGAMLWRRWSPGAIGLDTVQAYAGLVVAALVAATTSAGVGALSLTLLGNVPPAQAAGYTVTWWQGDLLGILLLTPMVLVFHGSRAETPSARASLLLLLAFLAGAVVYGGQLTAIPDAYLQGYWSFLFVLAAALMIGRRVTVVMVAMTAVQLLTGLALGVSRFGPGLEETPLTVTWLFLVVLSVTGMAASLVVHERRQAALALARAGERSRRTLEAMAEGLVLQDSGGRIVDSNLAAERILGRPAAELRGTFAQDGSWRAIREDGTPLPAHEFPSRLALATGKPVRDAVIGFHRDGEGTVWLSSNAVPLLDAGGRPEGVVSTFFDITTLRATIDSLKRAAEDSRRLASIIASADDAIFSTTLDGTVLAWNRGAERLTGHAAATAPGQRIDLLLACGDDAPLPALLAAIARGETVRLQREICLGGSGVKRHAGFAVSPIHDERGAVLAASWIVRDISDRVRAEEAMRELNRELDARVDVRTRELQAAKQAAEAAVEARSRFIANVSHEIRTPLNAVLGMTHLAMAGEVDPRRRDYLEKIRISGEHLLALMDSILDFSRVEAGVLVLESIPFSLDDVVRTVSAMAAPLLEAGGRGLVVDVAADVPRRLVGDPLRLRQMLINYINNAIKFSSRGDVTLSVRRLSGGETDVQLRFDVEDFGIGVPAAVAGKLFDPFLQADPSTSRRYGGTGLGLAITAQLATLMGGTVGVDSEEGVGSHFWFTAHLRAAGDDAGESTMLAAGDRQAATRLQHLRLLVVEDSELNREVFEDMLALVGARVTSVASGQEALDTLRGGARFDVILMDIQMPGMDGIETLKRVRDEHLADEVPAIALTANTGGEYRDRCLAAGMVGFIAKPVRPADLYAGIAAVVSPLPRELAVPVSARATNDDAEVIDIRVLFDHIGERPGMRARFVGLFLDMASTRLVDARNACESGDMARLSAIGHQLKSSARQIGALTFGERCAQLEMRSAAMSAEEARRLVGELQAILVRIGEWQARQNSVE